VFLFSFGADPLIQEIAASVCLWVGLKILEKLSNSRSRLLAGISCKKCYDGTKSDCVSILQLGLCNKDAIDLRPVRGVQILQPIAVADSQKQGVLR
jgi:hypothetical protein